ncbi:MAG TPA: heme ABC exporter ATP-binding protein CcmA [Firmicutes bacterium]|nr:heme ABC exporter ATP-binding protein CcmA [Bacillota bacterium]HHT41925.1 heme ABC exporter ATP-binding protein CcmA [Bacillota bacterium]
MAVKDVLVVKELQKQLGHKQILKNISFQAVTGDLLVITGPNGAGKTTLLRILAGLLPKSGGEVLWNGAELALDHGRVGYISHQPMLYANLTVQENLRFFGEMYGTMGAERVQELLELVGLWLYRLEMVSVLSRGMQQRLAIARALMADPTLILYDEPFTSLDADGREILRQVFEQHRDRSIQLAITHEPQHFAGLTYRHLGLDGGRVVERGYTHA